MRIITDIDPVSPQSPAAGASWLQTALTGPAAAVARACFTPSAPLFVMEEEGAKLSGEFPLVVWQHEPAVSQLTLGTEIAGRLPSGIKRLVLVASRGNTMRGHFDRRWAAAEGNLHVTVINTEPQPVAWAGIGPAILPVLALTDCAQGVAGERRVTIKWINDIMVHGAKIGGALSHASVRGDMFTHVVMGMGLNTHVAPDVQPTAFVPRVASLGLDPGRFTAMEMLKRLLSAVAANDTILQRGGGGELARRYIARCESIGRHVRIYADGPGLNDRQLHGRRLLARGVLEEVKEDMRLVVNGHVIPSGRLAYEEDCHL